jgi:hypothetical protein
MAANVHPVVAYQEDIIWHVVIIDSEEHKTPSAR